MIVVADGIGAIEGSSAGGSNARALASRSGQKSLGMPALLT